MIAARSISPKFNRLLTETRRCTDQADLEIVTKPLVFKRFAVSRVRIELTTRGFSIPATNRHESTFKDAGSRTARHCGTTPFDRTLTVMGGGF